MHDLKATWEHKASQWVGQADDPQNKYTRLVHLVAEVIRRHLRMGNALDVGCGPGVLCVRLMEMGLDPRGTDIPQNMIEAAGTLAARLLGKAFVHPWYACRQFGISWPGYLGQIGGVLLVAGVLFTPWCLLVRTSIPGDSWPTFWLAAALALLVYIPLATLILLPSADRTPVLRSLKIIPGVGPHESRV